MGTSASFARKALSCLAAASLAFTLVPAGAFAGQESAESSGAEGSEGAFGSEAPASPQPPSDPSTEADGSTPIESSAQSGTLAASLMGRPASFVNADVALDGEPVIGSFTIDGLTFAVTEGSDIELVGVSGLEVADSARAASEAEAEGSASEVTASIVALPESVAYNDAEYSVASIGAYAFYLSGVTSVELPASVIDVDDRAFRSSDVASVEVAAGNPSYSSFDGALYDADQSSLLLIPEGKQGAVLLPKETEVAEAGKFSHCSLVEAISAEGGAAFASENGLLYDASLTTLLRVPTGATDITIREGCTTIAAGAMEGCASLATINAPASVASISPDIFTSMPTVSLPAASVADDGDDEVEASASNSTQITAMVALSTIDDDLPEVDLSDIIVCLPVGGAEKLWQSLGFKIEIVVSTEPWTDDVQAMATQKSGEISGINVNWIGFQGTMSFVHRAGSSGTRILDEGGVIGWESVCRTFTFSGSSLRSTSVNSTSYYYDIGIGNSSTSGIATVEYSYSIDGPFYQIRPGQSVTLDNREAFIWLNGFRYTVTVDWVAGADDALVFDRTGVDVPKFSETLYRLDFINSLTGFGASAYPPDAIRRGYRLLGWCDDAGNLVCDVGSAVTEITSPITLSGVWERIDYDLGFDVGSEPGDEDYPGIEKPDEAINADDGPTVIEDPKRPGYVFQGWVIPDANGEHAIDQDLVYQDEVDGKWYVDASKLPDYADDSGRVELTARWTSVISVDVPSAATFYYDLVTDQSGEAHEAALSGTTSFSSRSQVDLRVCGLESVKAAGADALFSSGADGALLSVYPAKDGSATTVEDAQGPAGEKPSTAVDFALDDIVLEAAFSKAGADAFSIPAGDDLTLSYRLNLGDGASLDYDKVLAMAEGDEASLASISYCFALNGVDHDLNTSISPPLVREPRRLHRGGAHLLAR